MTRKSKKIRKWLIENRVLYVARGVRMSPNEAFAMHKEACRLQVSNEYVYVSIEFLNRDRH